MDYVKLFLLFMSTVAGLKIVSNAIARQPQQNYDGSAFCVNWVGSEALFRANNATVWKSTTMTLGVVLTSRLLFSNGACEQAVKNENSFGGSGEGQKLLTASDDVRIESSRECVLNSLFF